MGDDSPVVIGIDVGTQSIRTLAFDARGRRIAEARRPTPVEMLDGGRGEYAPDALFATVLACLAETAAALRGRPVAGMAVASMGESCVPTDAAGRALSPSLIWYDRRPEPQTEALLRRIGDERAFQIAGLALKPTLTLAKLAWMREHWPEAIERASRILMIADWIAFRLSGVAATDFTLASRTAYLDISGRRWSEELLALVGLGCDIPAPLVPSGTALGPVRPDVLAETGLAGAPVVAAGGHDHLCGSYAVGVNSPGALLDSMGTAEAMLLATAVPLSDPAIMARGFNQGAVGAHRAFTYIGAGINSCGGSIEWLRALAGSPPYSELIAEAEAAGPGSGGVVFLPHLAYSPPPDPDTHGRGAFIGLTTAASRGAMCRAVLEGLSLQAAWMLDSMTELRGIDRPHTILAIGGNTQNALFMRIKASAYGMPLTVVEEPDATALGAALLGGVAARLWPDLDAAVAGLDRQQYVVDPDLEWAAEYGALQKRVFSKLQAALKPLHREISDLLRPEPASSRTA
jgi:xylulokinase